MAAIVKANPSLTAGGLAVLRREFNTSDRGQLFYGSDYVCLAQFAERYAPQFRSGAKPPTPIPSSMRLLNLSRTPTLESVQITTENGLTYFRAQYIAGVETDLVVTTTSEQRNISFTYELFGVETTASFDYISISVTVTGTNTEIPIIKGSTGAVFNTRNVKSEQILNNRISNLTRKTIESSRTTRGSRGEYENSATSTGIYDAFNETIDRTVSNVRVSQQQTKSVQKFPSSNYDPTSLSGIRGQSPFRFG